LLQGFVKKTFWTYMNAATIPAPASDFNALASLQNDVALADTVMPDTEFSYAEAPGLQFCEGLLKGLSRSNLRLVPAFAVPNA
jgi:hypothetical protein